MGFGVLAALIILNEIGRARKWTGIAMFIILPAVLTVALWPKTAGPGTSMNDWFHWAKVYSALTGCIGFMAIRFIPKLQKNKWALAFPPLILSINICEAVFRDFQVSTFHGLGLHDGMMMVGGSWNIMNGIAGILNIVTITGWLGIYAGKGKSKDMIWADQLWFWIIAYDLWNYAYTYNCLPDHSFYCGVALLLACTIPTFIIKKGAWLQHRAQTLAIWCMFAMTCPSFIDTSKYAVHSSHNPAALFIVSFIALVFNAGVLLFEIKTYMMTGLKGWRGKEMYIYLDSYQDVDAATKETGVKNAALEPVAAK
jgi:hypothetical protein